MIYTVTFNPSVDYVMDVGNIAFGGTNRAEGEVIRFGGKGINVSLILNELGIKSVATGFIAGFTGEAVQNAVFDAGVRCDFVKLKSGNTRINVKLKGSGITEINADGPNISESDIGMLINKLSVVGNGDTLILAGSVPCSAGEHAYSKVLSRLNLIGVRIAVDASKALLRNTLSFSPYLIKPNISELEDVSGRKLDTYDDIASAVSELQSTGARNILVSMGNRGAIFFAENGNVYKEDALGGKAVNTVGAGDSMLAGFIAGIEKGYDTETALKLALACGGATACSTGLAKFNEIKALFPDLM